jgi:membrane protein
MTTRTALERRGRRFIELWIDEFARHDLLTCASAVAFQVLKSLVPLSLLGIALLGAIGREDIWTNDVAPTIKQRFDPAAYRAVDFAVKKIFANDTAPLVIFAAALTLWYVAGGVRAIMTGINRIYEADETRPVWVRWPLSFVLAVGVVAGIVGAAVLVKAVPKPTGAVGVPVTVACWVGAVAALAAAAGLLVRFAPAERPPKKWASAGGVLVVLSWILFSLVFAYYVSSFANFKSAAGQLTVFLLLMVYVYASSIVFLLGVEVDELLREDASAGKRGILDVVLGK